MEASPFNMAKFSMGIIPKLKRCAVENGVKMWRLTTVKIL
jgi:hypothetical protein